MQCRPTLKDIRKQYHFEIPSLAEKSNVQPPVIVDMLDKKPVEIEQAHAVLAALSLMHEKLYTREIVDVPIVIHEEGSTWRYRNRR
jgi:hypothetical protein